MQALDIVLLLPLLWFAWRGLSRGLVNELASLIALLLGIWAALRFSDLTQAWLIESFDIKGEYTRTLAFSLTFLAVVFVVNLIGRLVSKILDLALLGWVNKAAGLVFGILKGALILSALIYIVERFDPEQKLPGKEARSNSKVYGLLRQVGPAIFPEGMKLAKEFKAKETQL
jgi:membrane protein required for colicin V production